MCSAVLASEPLFNFIFEPLFNFIFETGDHMAKLPKSFLCALAEHKSLLFATRSLLIVGALNFLM